jgi:hypothetical protein
LKENIMRQILTTILPCVVVFIALGAASPLRAEVLPLACEVSPGQIDPANPGLKFERMPEDCLKTMFMQCSAASEKNVLGMGTVMVCSSAYEALLKRVFSGDYQSFLAWWQDQRIKFDSQSTLPM